MAVNWSYYNRFEYIDDMYLPRRGEGETMATQIVTAVAKLVYKYYNDGDVYDTRYHIQGWANDLSTYANWLYKYYPQTREILDKIKIISDYKEYEDLLKELTDVMEDEEFLKEENKKEKQESIYTIKEPFKYVEPEDDDYDDYDEDDDEWF